MTTLNTSPQDIASFYLSRAIEDGDLITNLKMQKLVYYAYCWVLTLDNKRLFEENLQAWANGPVSPSLYRSLSKYKSSPIPQDFIDESAIKRVQELDQKILYTIDSVYETYITRAAYELVALTHNELPWENARKGLSDTERSSKELDDKDILSYFSNL